jgi:hypothetical protein
MENLLQILSSLISFTTQHFADVAHVVMKREENKVETISTCRNDVYTGNEALRNWQFHVGEKLPVSSPLQPDPLRRHSAFPSTISLCPDLPPPRRWCVNPSSRHWRGPCSSPVAAPPSLLRSYPMVVRPSLSPGGAGALSLTGLPGGPLLLPSGGVGAPKSRVALLPPGGGTGAPSASLPALRRQEQSNSLIPRDETKQRREELAAMRVNLMALLIDPRNREEGRH